MVFRFPVGLTVAVAALVGAAAPAEAKALVMAGPPKASQQAVQAELILLGKVTEIEKDQVETTPFPQAPKEARVAYKIAVVKIQEALVGGRGLTQLRVAFPADALPPAVDGKKEEAPQPALGLRRRPGFGGPMNVALTAGMEGCFFLNPHHEGEFYLAAGFGGPLLKTNKEYAKELEEVKKVVNTIDEPVKALKAAKVEDRYQAAMVLLQRYNTQQPGSKAPAREAIPDEENKLIIALMKELPWAAKDTGVPRTGSSPVPPSRSQMWYMINPHEQGFQEPKFPPQRPGDPPPDYNKTYEEATSKFLKEKGEKIKIKRFVRS